MPLEVLATQGLTRVFRTSRRGASTLAAVAGVSFTLAEHEILAIVGRNGAGKSTLIDLLAGVLAPTAGVVHARGATGYVPSGGRALYPRLTARQNLEFFGALHGICGSDLQSAIDASLRLVGAEQSADTRVDRLSDGLAARVSLGRALLPQPDILLLDEPARSVDLVHRPALLMAVRAYVRQGCRAAVMVTHDIDDVFAICDRVAVMRDGRFDRIDAVASTAARDALHAALQESPS